MDMPGMDMPSSSSSSSSSSSNPMFMGFTTSTTTPLFAATWTPRTSGSYGGTCIFLIVLAIVFRALLALRANLNRRTLDRDRKRRYVVVAAAAAAGADGEGRRNKSLEDDDEEDDDDDVEGQDENEKWPARAGDRGETNSGNQNANGTNGNNANGVASTNQRHRGSTNRRGGPVLVGPRGEEEKVRVLARRPAAPVMPWRFSTDLPRAALLTVIAGVAYLLMLAVMTMNVGYFLSILGGTFIGDLAIGRFGTGEEH